MQEAAAATQLVGKAIHPEAQIIWGLSLDDAYGDEVRVTVIAAGFDANSKKAAQAEAQKQAEPAESTVPLSALSAAPRAAAVPQQPQPQLIQTPEAPKVQPLSTYIPSTPEPVVRHSTRPPSMKWCLRTMPAIWIFRISCAKSNAKTRRIVHGRFYEKRDVLFGHDRRCEGDEDFNEEAESSETSFDSDHSVTPMASTPAATSAPREQTKANPFQAEG